MNKRRVVPDYSTPWFTPIYQAAPDALQAGRTSTAFTVIAQSAEAFGSVRFNIEQRAAAGDPPTERCRTFGGSYT